MVVSFDIVRTNLHLFGVEKPRRLEIRKKPQSRITEYFDNALIQKTNRITVE